MEDAPPPKSATGKDIRRGKRRRRRGLSGEILGLFRAIKRRLRGRDDSEHEQIAIRVVIISVMFVYLRWMVPADNISAHQAMIGIYAATIGTTLVLFAHLLFRPGPSHWRRVVGAVLDAISINATMYIGGEPAMLCYPFLLWSILGYGFRFGATYLAISAVVSVTLFTAVVTVTPAWQSAPILDIGLIIALVMLPAYFAVLLGKLQHAIQRAEDANLAKSQFLATMSHELRTPLNAVIGTAELLRTTELDHDQRNMASTVRTAAKSLLVLINDILDFAKIESGRFHIELESFDLQDELASLVAMLHAQAQDKGLYLRRRLDPTIPFAYRGGIGPIRQVLVNLTANAIKFTQNGGVVVQVTQAGQGPDGVMLRFEVYDTGPGIRMEDQKRVFDRFVQAEDANAQRRGGTGLGLSISRELVELMGGRMGLVSSLGTGSTFWFELPLEETGDEPVLPSGCHLIVLAPPSADDLGLHTYLAPVDAAIDAVGGTLQRIRQTEELIPALASGDGPQAVLAVGSATADVPSIVTQMSEISRARPPDIITLDIEARSFINQAMCDLSIAEGPDQLLRALVFAFAEADRDQSGEAGTAAIKASTSARILLAEDNRTNQQVIKRLLEQAGHQVTIAQDGTEALEFFERESFDIVLLDINMPRTDGFTALKLMRFTAPVETLPPILALSADATDETRQRALSSGFTSYLTKPVDIHALLGEIDRLARPSDSAVSVPRPPAPTVLRPNRKPELSTIEPTGGVLDEKKVANLLALDAGDGFFAGVVDEYLEEAAELLAEMQGMAESGLADELRDRAHALKSSSAHMGVMAIFDRCVGWRDLDDHALVMRARSEVDNLMQDLARARDALEARKPRASRRASG